MVPKNFVGASSQTPILLSLLFRNSPVLGNAIGGFCVSILSGVRGFWQIGEFNYTQDNSTGQLSVHEMRFFIAGKDDVVSYAYYCSDGVLLNLLWKYGCNFRRAIYSVAGQRPLTPLNESMEDESMEVTPLMPMQVSALLLLLAPFSCLGLVPACLGLKKAFKTNPLVLFLSAVSISAMIAIRNVLPSRGTWGCSLQLALEIRVTVQVHALSYALIVKLQIICLSFAMTLKFYESFISSFSVQFLKYWNCHSDCTYCKLCFINLVKLFPYFCTEHGICVSNIAFSRRLGDSTSENFPQSQP